MTPRYTTAMGIRGATIDKSIRQRALELYVEHGPTVAANELGLARTTVSMMAHRAGLVTSHIQTQQNKIESIRGHFEQRRLELAESYSTIADLATEEVIDGLAGEDAQGNAVDRETKELKDLTVMAAIATDKMQLLTGEATSRVDRGSSDDKVDGLVERLKAKITRTDESEHPQVIDAEIVPDSTPPPAIENFSAPEQ